jgi:hypothetical protein
LYIEFTNDSIVKDIKLEEWKHWKKKAEPLIGVWKKSGSVLKSNFYQRIKLSNGKEFSALKSPTSCCCKIFSQK